MKKKICNNLKKAMALVLGATFIVGGTAGCSLSKRYEVANYQGELAENETVSDYNKELFYRNDKQTNLADPYVFDNTKQDGYYYLYGTENFLFCYRSQNMMDWEPVGNALDEWHYESGGSVKESTKLILKDLWAPEVVYDEEMGKYYMYFSATPQADDKVQGIEEGDASYTMMVAVSDYPDRGYKIVNFQDTASCGAENLRSYDPKSYPQYYAKYSLFDPAKYTEFVRACGLEMKDMGGYSRAIDAHPYVDDDGQKYLFWCISSSPNIICGIQMKNWLTPDWSTVTALLYSNYYTVEDYKSAKAGGTVQAVTYEDNVVNEAPSIVKHNGKYYMTFSVNGYENSSYQVCQAVADNILGPYRKLTEEEGGILLSGGIAGSQESTGTGHNSFVTIGEQMYIVYHRHDNPTIGGAARHQAIDEIKWITVKDQSGEDLEVMYANGPTSTVQPAIEVFCDYKNIADEAKVSGTGDSKYLTDDLLSIYKYGNENFMQNIKEAIITKKTKMTFDFDTPRTVRAVMVYNSKLEETSFEKISEIEFVCEENGEEVTYCIKDVMFTPENYKSNDLDGTMYYITPGACAYAEFEELNVKTVRIIVEVPKGQEAVGISEIRILGK